jgi:hypothetical protein
MSKARQGGADTSADELNRVTEMLAGRLRSRGVLVHPDDSADELGNLMEAVEAFEAAVEARGGDLMVDEPPAGKPVQPDNASFALPIRTARESAQAFLSRIEAATARLRA